MLQFSAPRFGGEKEIAGGATWGCREKYGSSSAGQYEDKQAERA